MRAADAAGVKTQLDALIARTGARSISCFLSTPTEPGTHEFVADAVARGIRVLLPITRADGLLDWAVAEPGADIAEGLFGMPEPVGEVLSPLAVNDVDLLVIPAAAVDRTGMRLGWGRATSTRPSVRCSTARPSTPSSSTPRCWTRSPRPPRPAGHRCRHPHAPSTSRRRDAEPFPEDTMPTYAYACTQCGHRFDAVQSFSDAA
jgi:hypothetical protein